MTEPTITFIGGGNMAVAIYGGLLDTGFPPENITVIDPSKSAQEHAESAGLTEVFGQAPEEALQSDLVVLAIKPQIAASALASFSGKIQAGSVVLSIIAGINAASLRSMLGLNSASTVVRCMPNTPALVGEGMTGLFSESESSSHIGRELAEQLMSTVGRCVWVNKESDLDVITAISGSGPAYFFLFMESLTDVAVEMGLSAEMAHLLAVQTSLGASTLASLSNEDTATLRKNVTSPGGTTERAIHSLEESNLRGIIASAAKAAARRSIELSEEFGG